MTEQEPGGGLEEHPLTAQRLEKLELLRAAGVDPYPIGFTPDARAAELHAEYADLEPASSTGRQVTVAGRLMNVRDIGKLAFGVLQDGTGRIQLFADQQVLGDAMEDFRSLDMGDWIGASGEVITTRRGELSVRIDTVQVLAKSLRPLPEKWHGLQDVEARHRRRYLDLTVNVEARATFEARSRIVQALRRSFEDRGFMEVETPMLQLQPGGALARPFTTHHNALGVDMYLRIAPELYLKRLTVGGFERVFEMNRNFRNEGISPRHNPEFTMLEAYMAYADYHDVMELVEDVFIEAAVAVHGSTSFDYQGKPMSFAKPWRRVTMADAVEERIGARVDPSMSTAELGKIATRHDIEVDGSWGPGKLMAEIFEATTERALWDPTFVLDYPKEVSPFARDHRDTAGVTERFEVIAAGSELANAFTELNDPFEQRRRFEAQARARAEGDDEAHVIDEDFLEALEYGMPPTGGLGIGVDRLVMLLTDQASIREVILFPHLRPRSS